MEVIMLKRLLLLPLGLSAVVGQVLAMQDSLDPMNPLNSIISVSNMVHQVPAMQARLPNLNNLSDEQKGFIALGAKLTEQKLEENAITKGQFKGLEKISMANTISQLTPPSSPLSDAMRLGFHSAIAQIATALTVKTITNVTGWIFKSAYSWWSYDKNTYAVIHDFNQLEQILEQLKQASASPDASAKEVISSLIDTYKAAVTKAGTSLLEAMQNKNIKEEIIERLAAKFHDYEFILSKLTGHKNGSALQAIKQALLKPRGTFSTNAAEENQEQLEQTTEIPS
jgi:hypothetical protein